MSELELLNKKLLYVQAAENMDAGVKSTSSYKRTSIRILLLSIQIITKLTRFLFLNQFKLSVNETEDNINIEKEIISLATLTQIQSVAT